MSQNFSKMSDIYIPELIELDSYWQKAVEDAIYDTLKGEKRLYYALRNRKKINEKLEKLGLKPLYSQMSFSGRCNFSANSFDSDGENQNFDNCQSASQTEWDSLGEENSEISSVGSFQNEEASWKDAASPSNLSTPPLGSNFGSNEPKDTPPEKMYRSPERPILGNGSLEKMKKSQNSFYCEPMGKEGGAGSFAEDIAPEGEKSRPEEPVSEEEAADAAFREHKNVKVEWLHFRQSAGFKDSDTEMSSSQAPLQKDNIDSVAADFNTNVPLRSNSRFSKQKNHNCRKMDALKVNEIPMTLDPKEDLFWEKEVKSAIRKNAELERKLYLALAKKDIIDENLRRMHVAKDNREIKIRQSDAKTSAKRRQAKKVLSPYLRFYLEVYRELCHKVPAKKIAAEAASRWWRKSLRKRNLKK